MESLGGTEQNSQNHISFLGITRNLSDHNISRIIPTAIFETSAVLFGASVTEKKSEILKISLQLTKTRYYNEVLNTFDYFCLQQFGIAVHCRNIPGESKKLVRLTVHGIKSMWLMVASEQGC